MGLSIMLKAPGVQEWVDVGKLEIHCRIGNIRITLFAPFRVVLDCYGVEYYRAGPFNSGGRRPLEGEWRFIRRRIPPGDHYDREAKELKWYWYRGRQISEFGDVGNWFTDQTQYIY